MYDLLFRLVLVRLDPERLHRATAAVLHLIQRLPALRWLVARVVGRPDPLLATTAMGITFPTPLGLAAGFDKDAEAPDAIAAFGFGFVEVGTVTAEPQPGNPRPRLVRLPADRALVNRMGFNNHGAAAAAARLAAHPPRAVVGVNIGKTKVVPPEQAVADHVASARLLAPHARYVVVNVSSPNTPGLRDLQAVELLRPILAAVQAVCATLPNRPPVLVKIAPDLADADVDAVADLALELGLDGIVAANTTIGRAGLRTPAAEVADAGAGGLSGPVLADRALDLLRRLRDRVGDRMAVVSVGGVATAEDVWQRLEAGADLVQAYTGLVYGGPRFAARINAELARRLREAGLASIAEVRHHR
jgi:dihydroorotate dehydrogenase